MIESTTEIPSLEGTSPRETASTSAHRVPNILITDYGRKKNVSIGEDLIRVIGLNPFTIQYSSALLCIAMLSSYIFRSYTRIIADPGGRAV